MKDDQREYLFAKYPLTFSIMNDPDSGWFRSIDCSGGWFKIIEELCDKIEPLIAAMKPEEQTGVGAVQVKEKYGGLRFYMHGETEEMSLLIDDAEQKSYVTCELCGEPGAIRNGSWILTLCPTCDANRKKNV